MTFLAPGESPDRAHSARRPGYIEGRRPLNVPARPRTDRWSDWSSDFWVSGVSSQRAAGGTRSKQGGSAPDHLSRGLRPVTRDVAATLWPEADEEAAAQAFAAHCVKSQSPSAAGLSSPAGHHSARIGPVRRGRLQGFEHSGAPPVPARSQACSKRCVIPMSVISRQRSR